MKNIQTGQYIAGTSPLHRLDARAKILCFILLIAAIVGTKTLVGYGILAVLVLALVGISGIPCSAAVQPVRRMGQFFLFIFLMNALFFDDSDVIFSWWIIHISKAGIFQGFRVVANVALILVLGQLLNAVTAPMEITDALERLMLPLRLLRVPVEDVAMILSVAIQFIPTLMEESDMIKKAQTARGARFESKNLMERAGSYLPLVIPIFLSAFRRADELSTAMEARGYRGAKGRTRRAKAPLRGSDCLSVLAAAAICALQYAVFS